MNRSELKSELKRICIYIEESIEMVRDDLKEIEHVIDGYGERDLNHIDSFGKRIDLSYPYFASANTSFCKIRTLSTDASEMTRDYLYGILKGADGNG